MSSTEGGWGAGCPEVLQKDTDVAIDARVATDKRTDADKFLDNSRLLSEM